MTRFSVSWAMMRRISSRVGLRWTDLTPPEWHDLQERHVSDIGASGSLQPYEKEYFRKDGSRVPVLIGVATFEEGGSQGVASSSI